MRRCRKQTDSFAFLKTGSMVEKTLPSPSKCKIVKKIITGIRTDSKKKPSICSVDDLSVPCCNDPECSCPQRIIMEQIRSRSQPLFCTRTQQGIPDIQKSPFTPDMLVTGFGLRNLSSLQHALLSQQIIDKESVEEEYYGSDSYMESLTPEIESTTSQTEVSLASSSVSSAEVELRKKKLEYFMGITTDLDEECYEEGGPEAKYKQIEYLQLPSEEIYTGHSESMRQAQKYIRLHRIFEFFQFLIAHLLSALPEDPIDFLVELLEKCLIYRSGVGEPPLLYRPAHINQLFFMMDRMKTGFIDLEQYKTGMKTLGICNFNHQPPTTKDKTITREFFIDEAYSKLTEQFDDMIKKHYLKYARPSLSQPPPTPQPTFKSWSRIAFIDRGIEEEGEYVDEEKKFIDMCIAKKKKEDLEKRRAQET